LSSWFCWFRPGSILEAVRRNSTRRYILLAGQILITTSLIFTLIFVFDWNRIGEHLASAKLDFLAAAVVCIIGALSFGALNIWILLSGFTQISFTNVLRFYLVSWCTFLLLPGSVGDAVQIVLLKEAGVPYRDGGAIYITDKQVTLVLTMLIALTGGLIYLRPYLRLGILLAVVALIGLVMTAAYTLAQRSHNEWVLRLLSLVSALISFCQNYPGRVVMNAIGTLIKLTLTALSHWLTFGAVGAELNFGFVFTVAIVAGLVAYLPVAFNGVGTVEFTAVTLYGLRSVPAQQVLATYVILRASNVLLAVAGILVSRLLMRGLRYS
jgi:uncharacterized membrane protein YbhN (UPF0104 family)